MGVNVSKPKATRHFPPTLPNPLFLRDEELIEGLELLEFALQRLFADQAVLLRDLGLGRSHQRLLHFIGRQPGITMAELLQIVPLTKQSQSRLLKELAAMKLITQAQDEVDRRQRLLTLTDQGRKINQRLNEVLRQRLAKAYRAAGADAVAGYHQVLEGLIDERARRHLRRAKGTSQARWQPS
jgi:DNA-binding MarR family transcriptional regulator